MAAFILSSGAAGLHVEAGHRVALQPARSIVLGASVGVRIGDQSIDLLATAVTMATYGLRIQKV